MGVVKAGGRVFLVNSMGFTSNVYPTAESQIYSPLTKVCRCSAVNFLLKYVPYSMSAVYNTNFSMEKDGFDSTLVRYNTPEIFLSIVCSF